MVDRPIMFSAPMIEALLAGRKSQTRRLLAIGGHHLFSEFGPSDTPAYDWHFRDAEKRWHDLRHSEMLGRLRFHVGDRLWVRESVQAFEHPDLDLDGVLYLADNHFEPVTNSDEDVDRIFRLRCYRSTDPDLDAFKPVPSIHMPRWASRLTLTVTDVRVERLRDITLADVLAEGAPIDPDFHDTSADQSSPPMVETGIAQWITPHGWYHRLWDSLHGDTGPASWDADPWVIVVVFTVRRGNIDG